MKVVLKSPKLDLEIEDAPSLDEVLRFIEKFFELHQDMHKSVKRDKSQPDLGMVGKAKKLNKKSLD